MAKTNRWMTAVLSESARTDVTMPWARGTRPDWQKRLAVEAPELAQILRSSMAPASRSRQAPAQPGTAPH